MSFVEAWKNERCGSCKRRRWCLWGVCARCSRIASDDVKGVDNA